MTSGVIEALILTPLDVTKTRLQLDHAGRYRGMVDCGRQLVAAEGPRALYKGLAPWTWHVVLKNGSRYYFNAVYRQMLSDPSGGISTQRQFVAGLLAGATEATLIVTPFEVLKTRLQATDRAPPPSHAHRAGGRAVGALERPCPNHCATEREPGVQLRDQRPAADARVAREGRRAARGVEERALRGSRRHPGPRAELPRGRGQDAAHEPGDAKGRGAAQVPGANPSLTTIAKEEGPRALYKGLLPRLARLCPSYAIQWVAVDQFMQIFGGRV
eukprot:CAMPEP_0194694104 /NCGR_PEP_ID=MMETSP0295-20121207/21031_1 /TAXON_ID=39354 /ORGANISM="Heterosigma akashiwo, Strain CCMP2393" /LENGTH=271 /DNA_ID=CAMNT_0039585319 /DNA_START=204 /DNA_END=1020 /DNA_ORIENTATION=-